MKTLKVLSFIVVILCCNVHAMEVSKIPAENYDFLRKEIKDIRDFAKNLGEEIGVKYEIVKKPFILNRSLEILGLNSSNTPLDIRYHYDLLHKKLSKNDAIYNTVEQAYERLMKMLLSIDDFHEGIQELEFLKPTQVETMELKGIKDKYQFLKNKTEVTKNTINTLKKDQQQQSIKRQPIVSTVSTIKILLNLPANASSYDIEKSYKIYMEENSPHKLISFQRLGRISNLDLKNKMAEIEKVKKAYDQYSKEIQ